MRSSVVTLSGWALRNLRFAYPRNNDGVRVLKCFLGRDLASRQLIPHTRFLATSADGSASLPGTQSAETPAVSAESEALRSALGLLRNHRIAEAHRVVREQLLANGPLPTEVRRKIMSAGSRSGATALVEEVLERTVSETAEPSSSVFDHNAVLRACEVAMDLHRAERIFSNMPERNHYSYAIMAVIYSNAGRMRHALDMASRALGGLDLHKALEKLPSQTKSTAAPADAETIPAAASASEEQSAMEAEEEPATAAEDHLEETPSTATGALTPAQKSFLMSRLIDSSLRYRYNHVALNLLRVMREELRMRPRLTTISNLLVRLCNANNAQASYELLNGIRRPGIWATLRGARPIELGVLLPALGCALRNDHYALGDLAWNEIQSRYLPAERQIVLGSVSAAGEKSASQSLFEVPDIFFYTRANLLARQDSKEFQSTKPEEATSSAPAAQPAPGTADSSTSTEPRTEVILSERMRSCFELLRLLDHRKYQRVLGLDIAVDARDTAPRIELLRGVVNSLACHVDRVDAAHFFLEHELVREAVPNTAAPQALLPGKMDLLAPLNCVIAASSQMGDLDRAFQTYETLQDHGKKHQLVPNIETFNALLLGCGKQGHWEAAKLVLEKIQEEQLKATGETHEKILYVMLRARRFQEAIEYLRQNSNQPKHAEDQARAGRAPVPFTAYRMVARIALLRPDAPAVVRELQHLAAQAGYHNLDLTRIHSARAREERGASNASASGVNPSS